MPSRHHFSTHLPSHELLHMKTWHIDYYYVYTNSYLIIMCHFLFLIVVEAEEWSAVAQQIVLENCLFDNYLRNCNWVFVFVGCCALLSHAKKKKKHIKIGYNWSWKMTTMESDEWKRRKKRNRKKICRWHDTFCWYALVCACAACTHIDDSDPELKLVFRRSETKKSLSFISKLIRN